MPEEESLEEVLKSFTRPEESLEERLSKFKPTSGETDLAALFPDAVEVDGDNYRITKTIELTEDTVLRSGNYQLSQGSELRVRDCKLIIQPGTTFEFGNKSRIYVDGGGLYAIGNEREKIEFLPAKKGNSANIKIKDSSESKLEYCTIKGLKVIYGILSGCPLNLSNSLTYLKNCEIKDNRSDFHGGGVYIREGSATFDNCQITGNTAKKNGGGVYVWNGAASFDTCQITGNTAGWNSGGGGVYATSGSVNFDNCQITGNLALGGGGVLVSGKGSTVSLDDRCIVERNSKPQLLAEEGGKLNYNPSIIKDGN